MCYNFNDKNGQFVKDNTNLTDSTYTFNERIVYLVFQSQSALWKKIRPLSLVLRGM
jgi:hypothetical protein